jgi:hypothetical protein
VGAGQAPDAASPDHPEPIRPGEFKGNGGPGVTYLAGGRPPAR